MSVLTVTNVADALAAMVMGLPDIVVLDRHLPDGWGDDVLGVVRAHPNGMDLPVLMLTADAVETSVSRLLELGATQVLSKPVSAARLKAELMLAMRSVSQTNLAYPPGGFARSPQPGGLMRTVRRGAASARSSLTPKSSPPEV